MDAKRLSLVIPAFNEIDSIATAVEEASAALSALFEKYEILVVDDGSTDDTDALVGRVATSFRHVRLVRHEVNRGYGAALRTGFSAARYDLVAFTDADCQFNLFDLGRMAKLTEKVPIVAGYRVAREDSLRRRFLSWGYNRLARTLLGTRVRDCDCALKVFRRDALEQLMPESRGFFVNTEMMTRARQLGLAVEEVPVEHRPRLGGESKVSLREVPRTLPTMLRFWWHEVAFGPKPRPVVFQARVTVGVATPERTAEPLPSSSIARRVAARARRRESA